VLNERKAVLKKAAAILRENPMNLRNRSQASPITKEKMDLRSTVAPRIRARLSTILALFIVIGLSRFSTAVPVRAKSPSLFG